MDESLRAQIDTSLANLDALIRRGRKIHEALSADSSDKSAFVANRAWQQDCGVAVHQLGGGSKAHWLARSFSEAFLMRTPRGEVIEAADPAEIVERLLGVLDQAVLSLAQLGQSSLSSAAAAAPPQPRRFDFVHNAELRPVLEQAYADARDALEQKRYDDALNNSCGVLEAIVTDALSYAGIEALSGPAQLPAGEIGDWSFNDRLAVAEKSGLIRGGCARLPEVARRYRDGADANGHAKPAVSEQEARRTTQVLHVIMRDLNPGR